MKKLFAHKFLLTFAFFLLTGAVLVFTLHLLNKSSQQDFDKVRFLEVQSIDTMKYSRDLARESLKDPLFGELIERQVNAIKRTGATHVAIGTPYDEEFLPVLEKWVNEARNNDLKVWFRGNFSGWEEWFSYEKLTREEHLRKTENFIINHPGLFEDGDIFTACPECENGGPGDPRHNNDASGHKSFLIKEYEITKKSFSKIGRDVRSNFNSMNKDVADLIMDKETTKALDGIVVIDHYVSSPQKLASDIKLLANKSGGKVVLGEIGAPIPDIHGEMSEKEQYLWLKQSFTELSKSNDLIGVNYWVNVGGSTEIWTKEGREKEAVKAIKSLFDPEQVEVTIVNALNEEIAGAVITYGNRFTVTGKNGKAVIPYIDENEQILINALEYKPRSIKVKDLLVNKRFNLEKEHENFFFKLEKLFSTTFFLDN